MADKKLVDEYIAMGGGGDTSALSDDELLALMEELAYADAPKPAFVQDMFVDQASQDLYQQATGQPWQNTADALALAAKPQYEITPAPIKAGTLSDEELAKIFETNELPPGADVEDVINEAALRKMTDDRDFITNLTDPQTAMYVLGRMAAQAGGSAINTLDLPATAAGLYGLTSMGVDGVADIVSGGKGSPLPGGTEAIDFANARYKEALNTFGVGEPRNVQESLAGIAGTMIPVPGPSKMNAAQNLLEVATPFVVGPKKIPRIAANFAVSAGADQVIREVIDTEDASYETIFDSMGVSEDLGGLGAIAGTAVLATVPLWGPMAVRTLMSAKGKAPQILSAPKATKMSDVERELPDDLYTITTSQDELGQYVLEDGGILTKAAEKAGVANLPQLRDEIEIGTGMAARTRVVQAMDDGKLFTSNGNYTAPVSTNALHRAMSMLPPQVQADYDRYLKIGDYIDNINARRAMGSSQPNDAAELAQWQKWRSDMRTIYPELGGFSKAVQQNTEAVREFISTGPYAMISKAKKAHLDKYAPHYIPFAVDPATAGDSLVKRIMNSHTQHLYGDELGLLQKYDPSNIKLADQDLRGPALDDLTGTVSQALELQINNSARGQWIDQMLNSNMQQNGKPLIRLATSKEVEDYTKRGMIVPLYRNGKREMYITEPLIAHGLRMDPTIMTNPVYNFFHTTRRGFEQLTTGVVTGTFPLVTGIRDTVAGAVMAPKGVKGPSIPSVITAPVKILGPKVFKAIYEDLNARITNNMSAWYFPGMDQAGMQQIAARLANTYQNSLYHMANEAGGIDASIMRTQVRKGKGILSELAKSIPAPISRTYGKSMGRLINGLAQALDSLQEAPRFAAFERNVKAGMPPDAAAAHARNLTGNTNKAGRFIERINGREQVITAVKADRSPLGLINKPLGGLVSGARTAVPYVHPSIQGMRRVAYAAKSDPVRFAQRAWLMMGMPAVGAWAWNKMISSDSEEGYDYDAFANENRASRDQVMEMYIGIPGLPPEQGISLPIAHEMAPFMSPIQTFLAHMGDSGEEMMHAMTQTGLGLLENMGGVSLPPTVNATFAAAGINPPDNVLGMGGVYPIREDNVGALPENLEQMLRAMYGQMAGTAVDVSSAFLEDYELQDAMDEYYSNTMSRMPVAKGVGGWRKYSSAFTPLAAEQRSTLEAYNRFKKSWDEHFGNPSTVQREQTTTEKKLTVDDPETGESTTLPFSKMGPEPIAKPINPLYELYGEQIRDAFEKNGEGMLDTEYQLQVLSEQIKYLNGFNAGRADDFRALQEELKAAPARAAELFEEMQSDPSVTPEYKKAYWQAKTAEFIDANNIDMGNRFDIVDLTNTMENWRSEIYRKQLAIVNKVEDDITQQLLAAGQLRPGQKFSIKKHLDPMADPMNIREPVSPAQSGATGPQAGM